MTTAPPIDPAIPFAYSCVCWIWIRYQKGILDHWGNDVVSLIYCFGKGNVTTQKRHQNFDYTTIADRLRTVSWDNDSHPTGVVKPVYGIPTSPLTAKGKRALI